MNRTHAAKAITSADDFDLGHAHLVRRGPKRPQGTRLPLKAMRTAAGKTQQEVAAATGIAQADVSRLETRHGFEDCLVSTLARYVEALGGKVELVAVFPNGHRLTIAPADR